MLIAGGLYREVCETPYWNEEVGSGVRAAAALSQLCPSVELYTYRSTATGHAFDSLTGMGVIVHCSPRSHDIAFAYFHPLSTPHIEPTILPVRSASIVVKGTNVLRFGFREGSAVVQAERAVYDPQTARSIEHFSSNGSRAEELALVLNEAELRAYTGVDDVAAGAALLLENNDADVVILKRGVRGALAVSKNSATTTIPAYQSRRTFKIGTGDIFSAVFAFYWAELRCSPVEAAHLASKAVSFYCDFRQVPLPLNFAHDRVPILGPSPSRVILKGSTATLGRRYSLEEARHCIETLGIRVLAPDIDTSTHAEDIGREASLLILADGLSEAEIGSVLNEYADCAGRIVLDEERRATLSNLTDVTDDFTSAIYSVCWGRTS
ncbi:carbohydrate kinase family protein [Rhizobium lentis]|uniref:carbohydrate kinase family protein n=1 Tax=Rhizobium lentis TaxID=1138194 RepID=UPI002180B379|nr:carbohydrate kinase family protein [Rhizobium lentis]